MRRRALLALVAVVCAAATPAAPGAAQGRPAGEVRLISQTPNVIGRSGNFELCLRLTNVSEPARTELSVTVYGRMGNRSDFLRTLEEEGTGRNPIRTTTALLSEFPPGDFACGERGSVFVRLGVRTPTPRSSDDSIVLSPRGGVYPVGVELRESDSDDAIDGFMTHLVFLPETPGRTLLVGLVLPVHAPAALQPGGKRRLTGLGDLRALAQVLGEDAVRPPLVLDPTPETLEGLAAAGEAGRATLESLRRALPGRQLLGGPYVPVSVRGMLGAGLDDELGAQLTSGSNTVARSLPQGEGSRPDNRTWVAREPLDDEALADLRDRGFDRVVLLPDTILSELPTHLRQVTLTARFTVGARPNRPLDAFAADADLIRHFDADRDPVLQANHLLADLAMLYLDLPGGSDQRGVVAVAPRSWRPTRAFLRTLLTGLTESPIVQPTTLDTMFTAVTPAGETGRRQARALIRTVQPPADPPLPYAPGPVLRARSRLDAFASILEPDNDRYRRLDEQLLVAESSELAPRRRSAYLSAVDTAIERELSRIRLPTGRSITLTARAGEIPVSFRNEAGYPVRVRVSLQSEKLIVRDGVRVLDLVRLNTTERFSVEARTSGDSALRIRVESPDGSLPIRETLLTVRSTAVSGVGLFLSGGAALFLVVWWSRDIRRRRRARRAAGGAPHQ
jgi:hypothetical protein